MQPTPGTLVHVTPRYAVAAGRTAAWAAVERVRLGDGDVAAAVAEVRALLADTECTVVGWWLSERSTPADVEARLLAAGLAVKEDDYLIDGLLMTSPPPAGPAGVDVRPVRSAGEFVEARELMQDVFETQPERRRTRDQLTAEYASREGTLYGAWIDGRLAGTAGASPASCGMLLWGGATAPWARGRGAYRALVRARWDEAVARGTPAVTVSAGPMSAPILRRLGFEKVVQFRRVEDVRSRE